MINKVIFPKIKLVNLAKKDKYTYLEANSVNQMIFLKVLC